MPTNFPRAREEMIKRELEAKGVNDPLVLQALRSVPRHLFVTQPLEREAYSSNALPIGQGQTISAPHMVGLMTQALQLNKDHKVLEVGTGSGYQAAVLAQLCRRVFTVERIPELARRAQRVLASLSLDGVVVKCADGTRGFKEMAPFDRILVTAGGPSVPPSLLAQLGDNGVLVMPVGDRDRQELVRCTKTGAGIEREELGGCIFVPLLGKEGFPES